MHTQRDLNKVESLSTVRTAQDEGKQITDEAFRSLSADTFRETSRAEPVILVLDEADPLVEKRSTVKDSHERFGSS